MGLVVTGKDEALGEFHEALAGLPRGLPPRIDADPDRAAQGLARLVLAVVDLLRRLMEKQALRRVEAGALTEEEVERMGLTFQRLEEKMEELKAQFGLQDQDLTLDLGPLGEWH